jgi:predicted metal-dependent phosphoesterase TrpH
MKSNNKYQTLHCHTIASDGLLTHAEVLDQCKKNKIGVVAFTDHDSLPSNKVVKSLRNNKKCETRWVIGIEISSGGPKDFPIKFSPHIVGLFIDPFNKELVKHCKLAQEARVERMGEIVKHLRDLSFEISEKECLDVSGGEIVARPHIVKALKMKRTNMIVIEKLRLKMKKEAEKDRKIKEQYDTMMERGEDQYPYVLFLSDDSFIKGMYVDYKYRVDLDKSVELIRNAGGVALFAHWFTEMNKFGEKDLDKLLKENRLDGIETVYGFDALTREEWERQRKILERLLNRYNKVAGGGADAHNVEHFEWMGNNDWYSKHTVGMAEKIIEQTNIDTTWSSFK